MRPLLAAVALVLLVPGCSADDTEVLSPVVLGMPDTIAPTYDDGQEQIFQVSREVRLPFRQPRDGQRPEGQQDPYPRRPFHVATDTRTAVRFTLSNLDDVQHNVELLVDPWNEFVRYAPGVTMAHKTGAVSNARTDAGIVYFRDPSDKKVKPQYAICVLTNENEDQRWMVDNAAQLSIAKIGKAAYDHFAAVKP